MTVIEFILVIGHPSALLFAVLYFRQCHKTILESNTHLVLAINIVHVLRFGSIVSATKCNYTGSSGAVGGRELHSLPGHTKAFFPCLELCNKG